MGCLQSQNKLDHNDSTSHTDISFSHQALFKIKEVSREGVVVGEEKVNCVLTAPTTYESLTVNIATQKCAVTTCVLPGLDPRGNYIKECQDGVYCARSETGFLAVLMDGHGSDGLKIVKTCIAVVKEFFAKHSSEFDVSARQEDPQRCIEDICYACDSKIKRSSEIDCSLSGSTAIILYANAQGLHVGSVGDSRAIMGCVAQGERPAIVQEKKGNPYFRTIISTKSVDAVQLTLDQKPNHVGEMDRIQRAGGRVAKITDQYGNRVGPYRVWELFGSLPGLAMSRSIGDVMASNVGVICTPVFNSFEVYPGVDLFVVMGSDGIW